MQIASGSSTGYQPNAGIKLSHSSSVSRVGPDESQMTLFGPKAFQVGTSGNSGVGIVVHAGEVRADETVSKAKSG